MKALSSFKQWVTTPSSPQTQQPKPLVKVSDVERPMDTQRFSHHRKTKSKCRKSVVKVARGMMTKKWIFVKRNKQVNALSPCLSNLIPPVRMKDRQLNEVIEMAMLFKNLGLPP
jgi:hypothetical protein